MIGRQSEILETENASLKKYNEYCQVVYEIDHMSDLHVDSSFYNQSIKIDNYFKITELIDSSIGQSTVLQRLEVKRPTLSNLNQTQNRMRYLYFEIGSHFICNLNLNNLDVTIFVVFKMTDIVSENLEFINRLIDNNTRKGNAKFITFSKTFTGGLGLLISKAQDGAYVATAHDCSNSTKPDLKFPCSKSNSTSLNKW